MEKQKLILYVDDDADDRELLAEAIRQADLDVVLLFANNGKEALRLLHDRKAENKTPPCLIILDLNMPFLDGKETYEALKNDGSLTQMPLIIFTSSEKPQDRDLFLENNIPFFTKPFSVSSMGEIAREMIDACR